MNTTPEEQAREDAPERDFDYFAVPVTDAEMAPGYPAGCILICRPRGPGSRFKPGDRVVLQHNAMKIIDRHTDGTIVAEDRITTSYEVLPASALSPDVDVALAIAGQVVAVYPPDADPDNRPPARRRRGDRIAGDVFAQAIAKTQAVGLLLAADGEPCEATRDGLHYIIESIVDDMREASALYEACVLNPFTAGYYQAVVDCEKRRPAPAAN